MGLLTPDERFAFDVNGYVKINDALSERELAAVNDRLNGLEALARAYAKSHPEIDDERVDVVDGKSIGLHIQNYGQKLWLFDLLSEQVYHPLSLSLTPAPAPSPSPPCPPPSPSPVSLSLDVFSSYLNT